MNHKLTSWKTNFKFILSLTLFLAVTSLYSKAPNFHFEKKGEPSGKIGNGTALYTPLSLDAILYGNAPYSPIAEQARLIPLAESGGRIFLIAEHGGFVPLNHSVTNVINILTDGSMSFLGSSSTSVTIGTISGDLSDTPNTITDILVSAGGKCPGTMCDNIRTTGDSCGTTAQPEYDLSGLVYYAEDGQGNLDGTHWVDMGHANVALFDSPIVAVSNGTHEIFVKLKM